MSYIDGNLLEGEHVVFRTRLHWKLLIAPVLFLVATVAGHRLAPRARRLE